MKCHPEAKLKDLEILRYAQNDSGGLLRPVHPSAVLAMTDIDILPKFPPFVFIQYVINFFTVFSFFSDEL